MSLDVCVSPAARRFVPPARTGLALESLPSVPPRVGAAPALTVAVDDRLRVRFAGDSSAGASSAA